MKDLVPATVPIIGHPDEVAMVLRTQQKLGRLLHDDLTEVPVQSISNGRVIARAEMLVPRARVEQPRTAPRRQDDVWRPIMTALASALILLLLGIVLVTAVVMLAGTKVLILAGIILACVVAAGIAMRSGTKPPCPGVTVHCPPGHKH